MTELNQRGSTVLGIDLNTNKGSQMVEESQIIYTNDNVTLKPMSSHKSGEEHSLVDPNILDFRLRNDTGSNTIECAASS